MGVSFVNTAVGATTSIAPPASDTAGTPAPTLADIAADLAFLRKTFGWPERPKDEASA